METELPPLTPTLLAGHLACSHLTQLERQRRAGALKIPFRADPRLEALIERGRQHEDAYIDSLRQEGQTVCDLRGQRDTDHTRRAMASGFDVIVQAPLADGVFRGVADVLLRVDASPATVGHQYEPIDTKLAQETKGGSILQLCTYCDLLGSIQGTVPAHFHVVTPTGRETYRTADFAAYYRHARLRLQGAMTATPPPETYPEPVVHCEVCQYWQLCDARRRSDDHPSLIASIRTAQTREFQRQGLASVSLIAQAEGELPLGPPARGSVDTYRRLGRQARLQVASRGAAVPTVERLPVEPERGLARLPEPSPGDIFLDFEGDPFVGRDGLEYLTGYCTLGAEGTLELRQQWALSTADEKAAFQAFVDMALGRLVEHPGMHIYHFGAYEPSALKRLSARHATRGEELDRLLRGRRFIDLHTVVREALCIGIERYGLKELEALHGFDRQLDLREAAAARRDLEIALELDDIDDVSQELRERVAVYNGDDCRSTASLRNWLEGQREDAITDGAELPRPALGNPEPGETVGERDRRIVELKQALTVGLPEDPEAWSEEERGRALLASMLGYFRQEEKNAWWEHFRLRDLPPDEYLDEREMLAGLSFVETLPRQGRQRSARCRFRFASQETAVAAGDKVNFVRAEDPNGDQGTTSATVEELDMAGRTVVLRLGADAADARPSTVFRDQVVGARPLEAALLGFAESVCAQGFAGTGPYAAASELLLRRLPKRIAGRGGVLRRDGESLTEALQRVCRELDAGVLPVQGPPGAGKTYNGARAILDLVAAGKTVGVTAVSHKVIDNLLQAVGEAALQIGGRRPSLMHKHNEDPPDGVKYVDSTADALHSVAPGAVVGGTVWLWASEAAAGSLDYLFIDEAGQMALAQALAAARSATNLVLLGDPQQLEQPQRGAHEDGADVAALVHLLGPDRATLGDEQGLFLDSTYRLHPAICAFTSEMYYEGRLRPQVNLAWQSLSGHSTYARPGLQLVEVEHEGNQAQAGEEVAAVVEIVRSLLAPGCTWTDRRGVERPLGTEDILVVAPYNAQVSALRAALQGFGVTRVGTVDRFQGQEAPLVLYSCTSSSPEDAPRGMAFLYDPHRFNVATSRARGSVIVVASPLLFAPDCRTPDQMRWANGLCRFRELANR